MVGAREPDEPGVYHAFLVRLWRAEPDAAWRASARDVRTGLEHHFASVERLLVYLSLRAAGDDEPPSR